MDYTVDLPRELAAERGSSARTGTGVMRYCAGDFEVGDQVTVSWWRWADDRLGTRFGRDDVVEGAGYGLLFAVVVGVVSLLPDNFGRRATAGRANANRRRRT